MSTLSPSGLKLVNTLASPGQRLDDNLTLLNTRLGGDIIAQPLTGLTGGGATNLDGLVTLGIAVGLIVRAWNGTELSFYRLRAGTDAESSPRIIRPDDYTTTTNEKVWERTRFLPGVWQQFATTADVSFTTPTATYVTLVGSVVGSQTIPANTLKVGSVIKVRLYGSVSVTGDTDTTVGYRIRFGSTDLIATSFGGNFSTDSKLILEAELVVRAIGASGSIIGSMAVKCAGVSVDNTAFIAATTIATNADAVLDVQGQLASTDGSAWTLYSHTVTVTIADP